MTCSCVIALLNSLHRRHVGLVRFYLGKMGRGQVAVCLSEMFKGRRSLLLQVPQSGLIQEIFGLLENARAAQLIALLTSLSSCQGLGVSVNQDLICECLLQAKVNLLPMCRLEQTKSKLKLFIHVPGSRGSTIVTTALQGEMVWHCVNDISDLEFQSIVAGDYSSLNLVQQDIKYFTKCLELYCQLTLGRNQKALKMLLQNPKLALGYDEILNFMQEETLPAWVRAQYAKLMLQLYVDRYPQRPKTIVHLARIWSEVKVNPRPPSFLTSTDDDQSIEAVDIPACTDRFFMLMDRVPILLRKAHGQVSGLNSDRIEFLSSVVSLAQNMIAFGFWVDTETSDPAADFSKIKVLFDATFELLKDPKTSTQSTNKPSTGLLKLRSQILDFLGSLLAFRTNKKISIVTNAYEKIFKQLDKISDWTMEGSGEAFPSTSGDYGAKGLEALFQPCGVAIQNLEKDLFRTSFLSDNINADTYCTGGWDDAWIQTMLRLCRSKDAEINKKAISFILRHMYVYESVCKC